MNAAELILNPDGSIYHLALLPEDIADTIILVGDQDRVPLISKYFDRTELKKQKREFITHTGWIGKKRITVLSTGIGTDNIDITLNELDALANFDFKSRQENPIPRSLTLIRLGTSGGIHPDIRIGDTVVSTHAIGTDVLGQYYEIQNSPHPLLPDWSYLASRYAFDLSRFPSKITEGTTLTCAGFYNPQGRKLRITSGFDLNVSRLSEIQINGIPVTNMEMETSAIYLLAKLFGHKAISFNAILAQRLTGQFADHTSLIVDKLIQDVLKWISLLY